jgi:hypothetical protein
LLFKPLISLISLDLESDLVNSVLRSGEGTRAALALNLCSRDILRSLSLIGIDVDVDAVDLSDSTLSVDPLRGDEKLENVAVEERMESGESRLNSSVDGFRILIMSTDKRRTGSGGLEGDVVFSSMGSFMTNVLAE